MKSVFTKNWMSWFAGAMLLVMGAAGPAKAQDAKDDLEDNDGVTAVTRDANGNVFVLRDAGTFSEAGTQTAEVQEYAGGGTTPTTVITNAGTYRGADGDYTIAIGLAVDPSDNIYVTTFSDFATATPGNIVKYTKASNYATSFTLFTGNNSTYGYFGSLAADSQGNLYTVAVFNASGAGTNSLIEIPGAGAASSAISSATLIDSHVGDAEATAFTDPNFTAGGGAYTPFSCLAIDNSDNIFMATAYGFYTHGGSNIGYDGGILYKYTPIAPGTYGAGTQLKTNFYGTALGCDPSGDVFGTVLSGAPSDISDFEVVNYGAGGTGTPAVVYNTGLGHTGIFPWGLAAVTSTNLFIGNGTVNLSGQQGDLYELIGTPTTPASNVSFSNTTTTGTSISWTSGSGTNRAVFMALASSGVPTPVNGTAYTANASFGGGGTQIGASGWYCVYNGTGTSVDVTGLSSSSTYRVMVVEDNGSGATITYNTNTATNNPNNVTTATPSTTISSLIASTSNTNSSTVNYTATFAASVNGLSAADFIVTAGGSVTGASVGTVSGSGKSWTVPVNTGTGDGTVQLVMNSSSGVTPLVSNATAVSPFTGTTVTIDETAPTVIIGTPSVSYINSAATVSYIVTWSDANLNTSSISLSPAQLQFGGSGYAVNLGNVSITGSGATRTISITGVTGDGPLSFSIPSGTASDNAGNTAAASNTSAAVTVDNTVPVVTIGAPSTTITNTGNVSYDVSFSDANFNTTSFSKPDVILNASGATGQVSTVQNSATDFTVTVSSITGDGTIGISVLAGTSVDLAGNTDAGAGPSATFSVDNTAPTATISAPSVASIGTGGSGTVTYTVTYADANFNTSSLTGSGITLNTSGTANGTVAVSGAGTGYTVTISNITGLGTLGISVAGGNATDLAGNTDAGAGPSATFNVLSSDATLSNLTASVSPLLPNFSPAITAYNRNVVNGVQAVTIVANTDDPGATILVNGTTPLVSGATSNPIPVAVGSNTITVLVTAADGVTTQTYTITLVRAGARNALLTLLQLSRGILSPQFTGSNGSYTSTVTYGVTSTTVIPATADANATVTVNGIAVASGAASAPIALAVGPNTINTTVTAQNDTAARTYTIVITRAPSGNSGLANLTISKGLLSPAFAPGTTSYTAGVVNGVTSITVTPTIIDSTATVSVNGVPVTSGSPSANISLNGGPNTITVTVTAQDNTTQTYTIVVTRTPSANASLVSLQVSKGALSPAFMSGTTNYTASVVNGATSMTVTPVAADTTAIIRVNGTPVASGAASGSIALNVGSNTITTVVTAQDGKTVQTYTLVVTRAPSTNASLASLKISKGALSPAFTPGTTSYTVSVVNGATSMIVTPAAVDTSATITVNGIPVTSGAASGAIPLAVGPNTITTVVTAGDGKTIQTYTIVVTRVPSANANLASLKTSKGALSPAFTPGTTSYTVGVVNGATSMTVTPVAADTTATITVNGTPVTSGAASGAIALAVGSNTITTMVTAGDGKTIQSYTLVVTRAPSANANLVSLKTSKGALSPAFTPGTTNYTVSVVNGATSMTVTPAVADTTATITVNGIPVTSGAASGNIALNIGSNTITTVVTAQDGKTVQTYTLTVTRQASSNANLSALKVSKGALSPAFTSGTITYTASVVNGVTSMTVTPASADTAATVTVNGIGVASGATSQVIQLAVGPNIISTIVTAADGTTSKTYTLTVTRAAGSADNFAPEISVTKPTETVALAEDGIQVHQGLSPNGDGINDFLQIENITNYPDNKLSIMNRNGQLIYEASGYDNSSKVFDGHSNKNGQMQLPGTYFYQLDFTVNGITKHKTGFIVLKY